MVKLLFLCRRRPDLSHERYAALLLDGHVPLALRHHPTLRRYTVNLVEEALGDAPPLDSVGALWFDTLADFRERLYDSPEGEQAIARDVAGFMGGADAYATREYVVRAPAAAGRAAARRPVEKLVVCLVAPPDAGQEAFVREWFERRAAATLARADVDGYVANVVQERLGPAAPPYAGLAEIYVAGADAVDILRLHGGAPGYRVTEYVQR